MTTLESGSSVSPVCLGPDLGLCPWQESSTLDTWSNSSCPTLDVLSPWPASSKEKVLVAQSCPTLCDPKDSPWIVPLSIGFSGQNTGVGSLSLLQGIFPIPGSDPGLRHCRQILYRLCHQRSPVSSEGFVKCYLASIPFPLGPFVTFHPPVLTLLYCQ